jgi:hypothetical protein
MPKLPLWFVTEKESQDTLAFSDINRLRTYVLYTGARVEDAVVANDRESLLRVIMEIDLRRRNAVYLNPDSDGHGGEYVLLTDLMKIA